MAAGVQGSDDGRWNVSGAGQGAHAGDRVVDRVQAGMERINIHRRVVLSGTLVDGPCTLRVCVVSHRAHHDRITEALQIITAEDDVLTSA
ncbi:hypothetical protein AB0D34_34920 [Streptomyces sp. NPDC048420]|uniref:hypothetical protein n=1 Tax=Streptomyces sp. NPDC048420 TaxID=3155755 RepID=UPI003425D665